MIYEDKTYQNILLSTINSCPISEFVGKRILFVGSTGLIGSFFVDLVYFFNCHNDKKIYLIGVNRSVESAKKRFSYIHDENIEFVDGGAESCKVDKKVDFIIHAASIADPIHLARNPVETVTGNVLGTINLLELAKKWSAKFLFVSSREAYGFIENSERYKENEFGLIDFNNIRAAYPESKRLSEILCSSYKDEYGVDAKIARLGYVYGPTQTESDSRAVAQFFRNAMNDENIVLKSAGLQKRSWTFMADCVSALIFILLRGKEIVYNVADENSEVSIAELADLIAKAAGTKVVYAEQSAEEKKGSSNNQNTLLDSTRLKQLGWRNKFLIGEGVKYSLEIIGKKK